MIREKLLKFFRFGIFFLFFFATSDKVVMLIDLVSKQTRWQQKKRGENSLFFEQQGDEEEEFDWIEGKVVDSATIRVHLYHNWQEQTLKLVCVRLSLSTISTRNLFEVHPDAAR